MDILTTGGLMMAWVCVVLSIILEGGHLGGFAKLAPAVLVLGGTLGAALISNNLADLKLVPGLVREAFFGKKYDYQATIEMLLEFAVYSRREGLLSLESRLENVEDTFLRKGVQMIIDGVDQDNVREIMETDISTVRARYKEGEEFFVKLGGFSPTLGIIGTVLGLVDMLGKLEDPSTMGPAIASAFIATLYGVSLANLLYLPLGHKMRKLSTKESLEKRIMLEGILAIQAGAGARVLQQKLEAFVHEARDEEGGSKRR
jgi:chemotaxis protein MotA